MCVYVCCRWCCGPCLPTLSCGAPLGPGRGRSYTVGRVGMEAGEPVTLLTCCSRTRQHGPSTLMIAHARHLSNGPVPMPPINAALTAPGAGHTRSARLLPERLMTILGFIMWYNTPLDIVTCHNLHNLHETASDADKQPCASLRL